MGRWRAAARAGVATLALVAGCGRTDPPADTTPVVLAEGTSGERAWRLEGWRAAGELCTTLLVEGLDDPAAERCGLRRTALRHLDAPAIALGGRLLVFSALPDRARRVRIDGADRSLHVTPAASAPGFPGRFFVTDLDPDADPVTVRVFGEGGRAVVT